MANETLTNIFSDIADAVRAKGVTGQMTPLQMPAKITSIPSGGTSGDPRYEVDQNGELVKKDFDVVWFSNLTKIPENGLKEGYINSNVKEVNFSSLSKIDRSGMMSCFSDCTKLKDVSFPMLTNFTDNILGSNNAFQYCFSNCTSLSSASFPELTFANGARSLANIFDGCSNLQYVYLPKLNRTSGSYTTELMFNNCSNLKLVDFHLATNIPSITSDTFANTNSEFKVIVPVALYT